MRHPHVFLVFLLMRSRLLSVLFSAVVLPLALSAAPARAADAPPAKAQTCVACHGPNGNSTSGMYPTLAGQTARYIYLQLQDFAAGRRKNPIMQPMAQSLSKEEMQDLAMYFAAQRPVAANVKLDPAKVQAGGTKANDALCSMCHLGGLKGQNEIPRLAGQWPEYVTAQLKAFRGHQRVNDGGNMQSVSQGLSDADIEDLAQYIASLY